MKRKKYKVRIKLIFETSMDHEQVNMEKAKQDVDRVLKGYLKNRKLNILNLVDDKPPRIIYKVENMISNYEIKKGDIYYAMLDPVIGSEQDGKRPVVVIQNNLANKHSPTVIVAPITTVIKKTYLPTHIVIYKNNFLKKILQF